MLDKPLSSSPFFHDKDYIQKTNQKAHSKIHISDCREWHYFPNYHYATSFFNKMKENPYLENYTFHNHFEEKIGIDL